MQNRRGGGTKNKTNKQKKTQKKPPHTQTRRKGNVRILKRGAEVADHRSKRHSLQVPRILLEWIKSI